MLASLHVSIATPSQDLSQSEKAMFEALTLTEFQNSVHKGEKHREIAHHLASSIIRSRDYDLPRSRCGSRNDGVDE
jgi:hypothetical protein